MDVLMTCTEQRSVLYCARYWCSRDPSVLYRSVGQKMLKITFLHKDSRTDEKKKVLVKIKEEKRRIGN